MKNIITKREKEIFQLLIENKSTREISNILNIRRRYRTQLKKYIILINNYWKNSKIIEFFAELIIYDCFIVNDLFIATKKVSYQ